MFSVSLILTLVPIVLTLEISATKSSNTVAVPFRVNVPSMAIVVLLVAPPIEAEVVVSSPVLSTVNLLV